MNKMNSVLREALAEAKPSEEEIEKINVSLKKFIEALTGGLKKSKVDAEVFVGGSFAKKTLMKKTMYDVDVYVRFDRKYGEKDISELTEKILKSMKLKAEKVHGSRDYFKVNAEPWFYFEVVPVLKVSNPGEADNITDLSYYHVKYVNKKVRSGKILEDIMLAKLFCRANKVYGAESHIKGFSGYSLELLIIYYKTFEKFLKAMAKAKEDKIIIDMEKLYRNKSHVMMDMNSSKLESPIILIDPTYKQRNALATLSKETFEKFQEAARDFLKNPRIENFAEKKMDFSELEKAARAKREEFLLLKISTDAQKGAIAGSKLLKFYNHLSSEISRHFEIEDKGFFYRDEQDADCYFIAKKKGKEILRGPPIDKKKEAERFRKKHKKTFVKSGIVYAEEKMETSLKDFLKNWKSKNKKIIGDMYIEKVEILKG